MSEIDKAILRAAVAAMPHTNPEVADDLIGGFTMHTEAEDIIAIWRAAVQAAQPAAVGEPGFVMVPLADEQIDEMLGEANRGFCIERDDYFKAVRDTEAAHGIAARPLTASPTAPTEASEPVGEREAMLAAWKECKEACGPSDWTVADAVAYRGFFAHGWQAARTTPPPAPLSDAEERAEFEAWYFDTFTRPIQKHEGGRYVYPSERHMFEAWCAGRASRGAK